MKASPTRPTTNGLQLLAQLLPIIVIIWVHLFLRWHHVGESMPYFIDEVRHVERARIVWTFQDIDTSTTPSKFGTYYWLGLFALPQYADPWLARVPIALFTALGVAGTFALGKFLFGYRGGLLAIVITTIWPFLIFFERMALTDPFAATLAVVTVWWSLVFAKYPNQRRALLLGVWINLMLAGKLLTVMLLIVPPLAIILFGKHPLVLQKPLWPQLRQIWHYYRPYLLRIGIVVGTVWTALLGFYQIRKWLYPDTRIIVQNYLYMDSLRGDAFYVPQNLERAGQVLYYYWSILLAGLAGLAIIVLWTQRWRILTLLMASILPLWVFLIAVAKELSTRYVTIVAHLIAVTIAGGILLFWQSNFNRWIRYVPSGVLAIWGLIFALPTSLMIISQPERITLPERDTIEYFQNNTSGYEVEEALTFVAENGDAPRLADDPVVMAALRICDLDPNYLMSEPIRDDIEVQCQPRYPGDSITDVFHKRYDWINATAADYDVSYLVIERHESQADPIVLEPDRVIGYVGRIARFERPHDGTPIEVYEIRTRTLPYQLLRWLDVS